MAEAHRANDSDSSHERLRVHRDVEATLAHYGDASYYDRRYRHWQADKRFYLGLVAGLESPKVLELGSGTGRIASALARAGAEVTGVELAPAMHEAACARRARLPRAVRDRLTFERGDLRALELRAHFDLVLAPFNVLMHCYTHVDLQRALRTVRTHLRPTGLFAFDVLMPPLAQLAFPPGKRLRGRPCLTPDGRRRAAYEERFYYDTVRQVQRVEMRFLSLHTRKLLDSLSLSQRILFPEELALLLDKSGLRTVARYGDFCGEPLHKDAVSQVYLARPQAS